MIFLTATKLKRSTAETLKRTDELITDMLSTALKLSVPKHATTARHKAFESRSPPSPFYIYSGNNRTDYLSDI